ncbi:MAG: AcrR family transcriptional regulator [Myxococcota bacterium]|jgi:AcrR family transcriptional regulator
MNDSQSVTPRQSSSSRGPDPAKRRRFLKVARRLFIAGGYAKTSVSAIVRESGVAQGTFYLYFKSKEQLLGSLRREVLLDYIAALETGSRGPGPADSRLLAGLDAIHARVHHHRDLVRVFRQAATGEESAVQVLQGRRSLATPLAALITEGEQDGSFAVDDPEISAHFVISLLANLLYEALTYEEPARPEVVTLHASRFLLRALGVPPDRIDALVPRSSE